MFDSVRIGRDFRHPSCDPLVSRRLVRIRRQTSFTYSSANPSTVTDLLDCVSRFVSYGYDPAGRKTSFGSKLGQYLLPQVANSRRAYNLADQLVELRAGGTSATATISNLPTYGLTNPTYDANGNMLRCLQRSGEGARSLVRSDPMGRLRD